MEKIKKSNLKLSTKTTLIAGAVLLFFLALLVSFTSYQASRAVTQAIEGEFTSLAAQNGMMVQSIIDNAEGTALDVQDYLLNAYEERAQQTTEALEQTQPSKIYNAQLTEFGARVEDYILNTAWSILANDPDIIGVSALFEPEAFDPAVRDYSIYIDKAQAESRQAMSMGSYTTYSQEDYYALTKESRQPVVTDPYEFNGVLMMSVSYPILYQNQVKGVFVVDINVDNFSRVQKSDKYPSMFITIYDSTFTLAYDSESGSKVVGMNLVDIISPQEATLIKELASAGQPFRFEIHKPATSRNKAGTNVMFFAPIHCGNEIWWTSSALAETDLKKDVNNLRLVMLALASVVFIALVFVISIVLRKMLKPIDGVVKAAAAISRGQLDVQLSVTSNDEIGVLSQSFMVMAGNLKQMIGDVIYCLDEMGGGNFAVKTRAADSYVGDFEDILQAMRQINYKLSDTMRQIDTGATQVTIGADQVSSGAQTLAQGAAEQASSVEELAATISEISQQVKHSADNALQAHAQTEQAGQEVAYSNQKMRDMVCAMDSIKETSSQIAKIVKAIEDIAFQTNILALNAAVEAARAGIAGRGFAVVADEVRNLAGKSAEAAQNTTMLVTEAIQAVENGVKIANNTAAAMNRVVDGTSRVVEIVKEISKETDQEANAIAQITTGLDQISSVVQNNSATSEESAAASEELSSQAQMLQQLISAFQLSDSTSMALDMNTNESVAASANSNQPIFQSGSGEKY